METLVHERNDGDNEFDWMLPSWKKHFSIWHRCIERRFFSLAVYSQNSIRRLKMSNEIVSATSARNFHIETKIKSNHFIFSSVSLTKSIFPFVFFSTFDRIFVLRISFANENLSEDVWKWIRLENIYLFIVILVPLNRFHFSFRCEQSRFCCRRNVRAQLTISVLCMFFGLDFLFRFHERNFSLAFYFITNVGVGFSLFVISSLFFS